MRCFIRHDHCWQLAAPRPDRRLFGGPWKHSGFRRGKKRASKWPRATSDDTTHSGRTIESQALLQVPIAMGEKDGAKPCF